jgi:hypothetical protein
MTKCYRPWRRIALGTQTGHMTGPPRQIPARCARDNPLPRTFARYGPLYRCLPRSDAATSSAGRGAPQAGLAGRIAQAADRMMSKAPTHVAVPVVSAKNRYPNKTAKISRTNSNGARKLASASA